MSAVQCRLYKCGHHSAKCTDVIKIPAHKVTDFPIHIRVFLFQLLDVLVVGFQIFVRHVIAAVQRHVFLDINFKAGFVLFYGLHIIADFPFQTYVCDQSIAAFGINPRKIPGIRVTIGISVLYVK